MVPRVAILALMVCSIAACPEADVPVEAPSPRPVAAGVPWRSRMRWKRFRVVQRDLARALALPLDEVCRDLGGRECATSRPMRLTDYLMTLGLDADAARRRCAELQRSPTCTDGIYVNLDTAFGVHAHALGGNDPLGAEQYEALPAPSLLTALALDRVVLSACGERIARDAAGQAMVFTALDLRAASVRPDDTALATTARDLGRRILSRDLSPAEIAALASVAEGSPMSARNYGQLTCYALATSEEFIFQ